MCIETPIKNLEFYEDIVYYYYFNIIYLQLKLLKG